ncbi:Dyp-type peroxidase [Rickenella mellea]|uniref:Dyp-type peroxidase n=1 Tax=Rickenella mellea TaxID=50990 RepID=A0A4Y7PR81_9AGAM|nr:Dyp-type peroxidase [Rickenella mellea]
MSQQPLPPAPGLNLDDIQGDVILGIPKRVEWFLFFKIVNPADFKKHLKQLIPAITTTNDIIKARKAIDDHKKKGDPGLIKLSGINVSFSQKGLNALGITDNLADPPFAAGQFASAQAIGDQGQVVNGVFDPAWLPQFKGHDIDGLFLFAGDSEATINEDCDKVFHVLGSSFKQVFKVHGNGFLDGVSLPAIASVETPLPGQEVVPPGIIVVGADGDPNLASRPAWAANGSFLVYRQLNQLVPEFDKFLLDNPIQEPGLPPAQGSELLGARLVGRWKSGAPIDITPKVDDPVLAADPQRNNNFDFSGAADQSKCPFAAHIRKTNPRSDLSKFGPNALIPHAINRNGIPFGPEVSPQENHEHKTHCDRGLSFVCYQTVLANGFEFLMKAWANNINFPPQKPVVPGFDPIIGQNGNDARTMQGTNPDAQTATLNLPFDFVVSKGGEYFFTPSITALKTKFTA